MPDQLPVICPACRSSHLFGPVNSFLYCGLETCAFRFPVIDGVPILVPAWSEYVRGERWIILRRGDLSVEMDWLLDEPLGDDHAERIRQRHLESYLRSHFGTPIPELAEMSRQLPNWIRRHMRPGALGLDAGCATGGYTAIMAEKIATPVGIDLHFERVRAGRWKVPNASFYIASAEDPPFERYSMDVVMAINLIDSIGHPRLALHNLLECVRPGGLLLLSTPFDYSSVYSPLNEWVTDAELTATLAAGFDIIDDQPRLPWVLPAGDRHSDVFFVRAVAAVRRG